MILILTPNIDTEGETYRRLLAHLSRLPNIQARVHREQRGAASVRVRP